MPFDTPRPAPTRHRPQPRVTRLAATLRRIPWPGAERQARIAVWRAAMAGRTQGVNGPGG